MTTIAGVTLPELRGGIFANGAVTAAFASLISSAAQAANDGNYVEGENGEKNPYSKDRVNKTLRPKIHVDENGNITTDTIIVSAEGVDQATAQKYIETVEKGWKSLSLDLELVKTGGNLRLVPCTDVCSVNPVDGGYLGAAEVGGRKIYYGSSQYTDTPVHETGHILGLSHKGTNPGSIMGGYRPRSVNTEDLNRTRSLYE